MLYCVDDTLAPIVNGEHTHASVAGSRLVTFSSGGHFFAGRFEAAREEVRAFLAENT